MCNEVFSSISHSPLFSKMHCFSGPVCFLYGADCIQDIYNICQSDRFNPLTTPLSLRAELIIVLDLICLVRGVVPSGIITLQRKSLLLTAFVAFWKCVWDIYSNTGCKLSVLLRELISMFKNMLNSILWSNQEVQSSFMNEFAKEIKYFESLT